MGPRPLRDTQIEILRRVMAQRRSELLEETREDVVRAREESYGVLAGSVTDVGDRASADLLADLGQAEISRDVREVEQLEAALARIDLGTYGDCPQCGAEIDFARLRVHPSAVRCARCQILHEATFAHPGNRRL